MSEADNSGDHGREQREARRFEDKGSAVGIECRVEQTFDAGEVEAAIFRVGMIAVDEQGEEGQAADQQSGESALVRGWGAPELIGGELILYCYCECRQRQLLRLPGAGWPGLYFLLHANSLESKIPAAASIYNRGCP